ncbi:DUF2177 family protein [uncultured Roseovarius sp.]|uniref:DUF2177 family protein n=1 Tax=uncultured Roseovarius sp. TaxID=293344 RepID=UPI00260E2692|nr:DUF2177 family protein [uncultured Roseovarius sp.]
MKIVVLYVVTALVFLGLDAVMLKNVLRPLFESHIGDLLADTVNITAALIFYLFYIAGILWFASLPALREGKPVKALISGGLLGAMAYGTYEFTNLATLKGWHWQMVIVDVPWGAFLTGVSAWAGAIVASAMGWTPRRRP